MLLLLQLAACSNDTFPKQSCQNFWTLYLKVYTSLHLRVLKVRMQTRLSKAYLALRRKSGRRGFPLVRRGCLPLGKLGCISPWIHPLLTVHQSGSKFKLTDTHKKRRRIRKKCLVSRRGPHLFCAQLFAYTLRERGANSYFRQGRTGQRRLGGLAWRS